MTDSAPPYPRRNLAVIWLMRGTGFVLIAPPLILLFIIAPIRIVDATYSSDLQIWIKIFLILLVTFICAVIAKVGYAKLHNVSVISVANFAFIFSFLAAKDLYHFLPLNFPSFFAKYVGDHSLFLGQGEPHPPGISYRATLAFLVFVAFYYLIKNYLEQVLDLKPSSSSQSAPPSDPDIPEFPQKSPLIQL